MLMWRPSDDPLPAVPAGEGPREAARGRIDERNAALGMRCRTGRFADYHEALYKEQGAVGLKSLLTSPWRSVPPMSTNL